MQWRSSGHILMLGLYQQNTLQLENRSQLVFKIEESEVMALNYGVSQNHGETLLMFIESHELWYLEAVDMALTMNVVGSSRASDISTRYLVA